MGDRQDDEGERYIEGGEINYQHLGHDNDDE
jgi:hypothetical protein